MMDKLRELKSTVVGVFLITLGTALLYRTEFASAYNDYGLYASVGLIAFGIYCLMTNKQSRKVHFEVFLRIVKKRATK